MHLRSDLFKNFVEERLIGRFCKCKMFMTNSHSAEISSIPSVKTVRYLNILINEPS